MTRPLGRRQLRLLLTLSNPSIILIVGDTIALSLARRGLITHDRKLNREGHPTWCRITPDGMRAAAAAYQAGLFDQFIDLPKRNSKKARK